MKRIIFGIVLITSLLTLGCDVQSGITKKSVEKYDPTPTPQRSVEPTVAIDPADVVTVDVALDGPKININPSDTKTTADCTKYNRVALNGDGKTFTIKGICSQIMINGDKNTVTAAAFSEIVVNGSENTVTYTKYTNGKRPIIKDNAAGNSVEKVAADPNANRVTSYK
jgi:hypothetical protein